MLVCDGVMVMVAQICCRSISYDVKCFFFFINSAFCFDHFINQTVVHLWPI